MQIKRIETFLRKIKKFKNRDINTRNEGKMVHYFF